MIDVHVLTHSGTRPEWLAQCLESLASEPCTVHVVAGTEGNIAAGRERGFALGHEPYLTFVDSDDYVLPGAMAALCAGLAEHDAVVGCEAHLWGDQLRGHVPGHHLWGVRRAVLAPHLPGWGERNRYEHCVNALARVARPEQINDLTYVWRRHARQSSERLFRWKP